MDSEKKKYILDLVDKLQEGTATTAEIKVLVDFYATYLQSEDWPLDSASKHIIKESIFKNIQKGIHPTPKKRFRDIFIQNRNFIKYAVAACIILGASTLFFINKVDQEITAPEIVNNTIEAGTDKATLTLDDGTSVSLEKNNSYTTSNISSDGEALVYASESDMEVIETAQNTLTVPRGGQFFVQLSDGTRVWLNSESQLKYPVNFIDGKPRNVELVYGEAYFKVSPSTMHKGSKFRIKSKEQHIEVLGTEFNVAAYKNEETIYTTLVEGKVSVQLSASTKKLTANQQAIVSSKTKQIEVNYVDVYNHISWKDGVFSFKEMPLKNIMKVLSRWYDVDIEFENKNLEVVNFNGTLRKDQKIEDILDIIRSTNNLNFKIKNKKVFLK